MAFCFSRNFNSSQNEKSEKQNSSKILQIKSYHDSHGSKPPAYTHQQAVHRLETISETSDPSTDCLHGSLKNIKTAAILINSSKLSFK